MFRPIRIRAGSAIPIRITRHDGSWQFSIPVAVSITGSYVILYLFRSKSGAVTRAELQLQQYMFQPYVFTSVIASSTYEAYTSRSRITGWVYRNRFMMNRNRFRWKLVQSEDSSRRWPQCGISERASFFRVSTRVSIAHDQVGILTHNWNDILLRPPFLPLDG